jgi:hypothetical protein
MLIRRIAGAGTRLFAARHRPRQVPSRKVAIAVPLSTRSELLPDEQVSMRHLCHFLGGYDKYLVAPRGRHVDIEGFTTIYFGPKFFGSAAAHNRLLYWPGFYAAFADYEYLFIYHLDSLVLSDQLLRWCDEGFDYIGAPWIPCDVTPWVKEAHVGNGGFTLINVAAARHVLFNRYCDEPTTYWSDMLIRHRERLYSLRPALDWLSRHGCRLAVIDWALRHWSIGDDPATHSRNNDYLWSYHATRYLPTFAVAPVAAGLQFAFEAAPRKCLELTGGRLPFGCHAWAKFDREFWMPYLLPAEPTT